MRSTEILGAVIGGLAVCLVVAIGKALQAQADVDRLKNVNQELRSDNLILKSERFSLVLMQEILDQERSDLELAQQQFDAAQQCGLEQIVDFVAVLGYQPISCRSEFGGAFVTCWLDEDSITPLAP